MDTEILAQMLAQHGLAAVLLALQDIAGDRAHGHAVQATMGRAGENLAAAQWAQAGQALHTAWRQVGGAAATPWATTPTTP